MELHLSIIEQVDQLLKKAIKENISDLHFEPYLKNFRIRYRKDGLLYEADSRPKKEANYIISRLKVMGNLDISEHRLPQDGRFFIELDEKKIDCRISTCPVLHGEKAVVRILDTEKQDLSINQLGMDKSQQNLFEETIKQSQGMILVTGPTGSGKTVTLYTALNAINSIEKNILTIEDPIEIQLAGINQVHVNQKTGLTFAKTLRAFLRQDPDVIMVGEIRDEETASIAIRAAQTGHLVLSTLHTNSAVETIGRLLNMGVEHYDIASALSLVIAQRLVRKLCDHCKKEGENGFEAVGCGECHQGHQGRTALFEMLPLSTEVKNLIEEGAAILEMQTCASHMGCIDLKKSGMDKIQQGIISLSEFRRVVMVNSVYTNHT